MKKILSSNNILVYSLAFVSLWFGVSEIISPTRWAIYAPKFLTNEKFVLTLIFIHGIALVFLALMLVFNIYRRIAAMGISLIYLEVILGLVIDSAPMEIIVRDIGLLGMALALSLQKNKKPELDDEHIAYKLPNSLVVLLFIMLFTTLNTSPIKAENTKTEPPETAHTKMPMASMHHMLYKNGTYQADGSYLAPSGYESIGVSLTLKNDVIIVGNVETYATDPTSAYVQDLFASNFKPYVIGKNIDEVHLTKVAGASLTPEGFNKALEKIKQQAK